MRGTAHAVALSECANWVGTWQEGRAGYGGAAGREVGVGGGRLRTFDRVVANPMWNQDWFTETDYDSDEDNKLIEPLAVTSRSNRQQLPRNGELR